MNDQQFLLANAYVDGDLDAAGRALAEADPDVMSEVERLHALRHELRRIAPATATARDAAIAAAMSVYAATATAPATAPVPRPARSTRAGTFTFRRRPAYARYLAFAAVAVAVGALGLVLVNGLGSSDDSTATDSAKLDATIAATESARNQAELPEVAADGAGEPAMAEMAPADDAASDAASDDIAESDVATAAADLAATGRPEIDPTRPLTTPEELGSFGTSLVELEAAGALPPTPNTACPQPRVLGQVEFIVDEAPTLLLVSIDADRGVVIGIDPDTCRTVIEGPLF